LAAARRKGTARGGRPTGYSEAIADLICDAISEGGALYRLCEERSDFPAERTVYRWLDTHPGFAQKYARARELQQDREADKIVVIADEADDAAIARLRIDSRKWRAAKMAPKKYGDRLDLNHSGSIQQLSDEQLEARLADLLRKAAGAGSDAPT
jgi:chromosome condensin MukBEF complex kleisin-like MukF subunit